MEYDDSDIIPDHEYEVVATFKSLYAGECTLDERHTYRKGNRVGKLRRADNPMVSISGVACPLCLMDLPRAKA